MTLDRDFGWEFYDQIVEWIGSNDVPEDVFDAKKLAQWAEENGYVLEDNIECCQD